MNYLVKTSVITLKNHETYPNSDPGARKKQSMEGTERASERG